MIAAVSAAPYIPPLPAFPAYSPAYSPAYNPAIAPAYTQPIISSAIATSLASPYTTAYPRADLAAYTIGEFGIPNYAPLASAYPLPAAYAYEYVYGR